MPGQHGQGQAEFGGEQRGDCRTAVAQRCQRAGGASELDGEPRGPDPVQSLPGFIDAGQPAGRYQAEGHGDGLLEQRPTDHDRAGMDLRQGGGGGRGGGHLAGDPVQRLRGEQHRRCIDDVLAGRAEMDRVDRMGRDEPGQRPD